MERCVVKLLKKDLCFFVLTLYFPFSFYLPYVKNTFYLVLKYKYKKIFSYVQIFSEIIFSFIEK